MRHQNYLGFDSEAFSNVFPIMTIVTSNSGHFLLVNRESVVQRSVLTPGFPLPLL